MREQCEVLKNVANVAVLHRQAHLPRGIEQGKLADGDASRVRLDKSLDAIEQRGLARSRGAKQDGEARGSMEVHIEHEVRFEDALAYLNVNRARRCFISVHEWERSAKPSGSGRKQRPAWQSRVRVRARRWSWPWRSSKPAPGHKFQSTRCASRRECFRPP